MEESHELWKEKRQQQFSVAEERLNKFTERIFETLMRRDNLMSQRLGREAISIQVQALITAADMAALVDLLVEMGKVDRAAYLAKCVTRRENMVLAIEQPN